MATIKGNFINVIKTSALVDAHTFYGFWFEIEAGVGFRKILRYSIKGFFPQYPSALTNQECFAEYVFQFVNELQEVIFETIIGTSVFNYNVGPGELVSVPNIGEIERFKLFQHLSEIGQLRLPENLINGMLNAVTKKPKWMQLDNPIFVSREHTSQYNVEIFDLTNMLMQPLVCEMTELNSSTPLEEPEEGYIDGSAVLHIYEATGTLSCLLNGVAVAVAIGQNTIPVSNGNHTLVLSDENNSITYTFTA